MAEIYTTSAAQQPGAVIGGPGVRDASNAAELAALGARIPVPKAIVLSAASAGAATEWLIASDAGERLAFELISGASANLTIDGSNDGATSAGQIATISLDTVGTLISSPIFHKYNYIKVNHLSGAGVVKVARGV